MFVTRCFGYFFVVFCQCSKLKSGVKTGDRLCDQCPDKSAQKATLRCLDCNQNYCNECKSAHSRFNA